MAKNTDFSHFANLRETFPSADQVGKFTVFNIGGNKVRLIASLMEIVAVLIERYEDERVPELTVE